MDSPGISQIHTLCLQMERHLSTPFPFSLWTKPLSTTPPTPAVILFTDDRLACRPISTYAVGV